MAHPVRCPRTLRSVGTVARLAVPLCVITCGPPARHTEGDAVRAELSTTSWRCSVDTGSSRLIFDRRAADFETKPTVQEGGRPIGTTGAFKLTGFASIKDTFELSSNSYVFVQVKARADMRGTNAYQPTLQVVVDHQQVANFEIATSNWQTYGSWTSQSGLLRSPLFDRGTANLEVAFINDWISPDRQSGRNVDIEWVKVFVRREECSGYHNRFNTFTGIRQPRNFAEQLSLPLGTIANYQMGRSQIAQDGVYRNKLKRMFRYVTPENQLKMRNVVTPVDGALDFRAPDQFLANADANGLVPMHGHTLVWYRDLPNPGRPWATLGPTSSDEENFRQWLDNYIETMVRRYSGVFETWHVVNEPLDWDGRIRTGHLFHDLLGDDYIRFALEAAGRARSDRTQLLINENQVLDLNDKSDALYQLVQSLRRNGTPIDGIGIQAHLRLSEQPNLNSIRANLERFAQLGLDVHITELDVRMDEPGRWRERAQADLLYHVVSACLDVPGCRSVSLWGFTDKYALSPNERPLLLDDGYRFKPNLGALSAALRRALGQQDYVD